MFKPLVFITAIYIFLICGIIILYSLIGQDDSYLRFGPHKDTLLINVEIDTWTKYICVIFSVLLFVSFQTYREVYVYPWIMNNIYDSKQSNIDGYTKKEVSFIVNGNYISDKIWYIFGVWLIIAQLDFALIGALSSSISNYVVVQRKYINKKKFTPPLLNECFIDPNVKTYKCNSCGCNYYRKNDYYTVDINEIEKSGESSSE